MFTGCSTFTTRRVCRRGDVILDIRSRFVYSYRQDTASFKILDEALAPEEYGIGVKKGNDQLLNNLQAALDKINTDGTAAEISKKWFGEDKILK